MKYLAILIVTAAFIWYYSSQPKTPASDIVAAQPPRPGELSAPEKDYYIQLFNYLMDHHSAAEPHLWRTSDTTSGAIAAGEVFISKSKATCRPYSETYNIGGYQGEQQGIACKRIGSDGWCRLKKTDALTCALEGAGTIAGHSFPGLNHDTPSLPAATPNGQPIGGIGGIGAPDAAGKPASPLDGSENHKGSKPGQSYADTVTGTAGGAAAPATGGAIKWFNDTFR